MADRIVQLIDKDGNNVAPLGGKRATKYSTSEIPDGSVTTVAPHSVTAEKLNGTEFRKVIYNGPATHSSGNQYLTDGISDYDWLEFYCMDDQGHYWVQEVYIPNAPGERVVAYLDLQHLWAYSTTRLYWNLERLSLDTMGNNATNPPYFFIGGWGTRAQINHNSSFSVSTNHYITLLKIVGVKIG